MPELKLSDLHEANLLRLPEFKNKHGELAHDKDDGSDWTPAQWLQAVIGELGEYANIRKKYERGDLDEYEFIQLAARELADTFIYLDILAGQIKIDLSHAIIRTFNRKSEEVGSSVWLDINGVRTQGVIPSQLQNLSIHLEEG